MVMLVLGLLLGAWLPRTMGVLLIADSVWAGMAGHVSLLYAGNLALGVGLLWWGIRRADRKVRRAWAE